eukprot:2153834-Pyramimonas_sp.AAC.1
MFKIPRSFHSRASRRKVPQRETPDSSGYTDRYTDGVHMCIRACARAPTRMLLAIMTASAEVLCLLLIAWSSSAASKVAS